MFTCIPLGGGGTPPRIDPSQVATCFLDFPGRFWQCFFNSKKTCKFRSGIWCHFGSILVSFWHHFGTLLGSIFGSIFEVRFLAFYCRFWHQFWLHFGILNRSRKHPDAKRSTLDFEQLSNENHGISRWRVPADTQDHSQKPSNKTICCLIDFRSQNCSKMVPIST